MAFWYCANMSRCVLQDQGNSDSVLDDVACLLACTRSSLHGETVQLLMALCSIPFRNNFDSFFHMILATLGGTQQTDARAVRAVVASEKGVVVGRLTYREDGDLIDCQRMGVGGKAIPPNVDKVFSFCTLFTEVLSTKVGIMHVV